MRRALSAIVVTSVLVWSSPATAQQGGPTNCSVVSQNLWVRDQLNDIYLWYQFLPSVNAASFPSPEAYLDAVRYRPIDNTYSYITSAAASTALYGESQYIGFGFSTQIAGDTMRILQVFPDSPASEAGLGRGDRITQVNGRAVSSMIADGSIGNAFGAGDIGVASDVVFQTRAGAAGQARLVKRVVTIPTVSLTRAFDVDGRRVGYLFFRNFVTPSYAALDEAFAALRDAGVNELVLDLRYNGGGLVDVAVHLSSLIGGSTTAGKVLATYVHNTRNSALNKSLRFEAVSPLNLSQLVVIATRSSASASELVINALRPYMPVAIIGDTTYGKPVGQYGIDVLRQGAGAGLVFAEERERPGRLLRRIARHLRRCRRSRTRSRRCQRRLARRSTDLHSYRRLQPRLGARQHRPSRPASRASAGRLPIAH